MTAVANHGRKGVQIVMRLLPPLRAAIKEKADHEGRSVNAEIVRALEQHAAKGPASAAPDPDHGSNIRRGDNAVNDSTNTTTSAPAASHAALRTSMSKLEGKLHDARQMAKIVSTLIEDRLPLADADGNITIGDFADTLTWAVYHSENMLRLVAEEWKQANIISFEMARSGR